MYIILQVHVLTAPALAFTTSVPASCILVVNEDNSSEENETLGVTYSVMIIVYQSLSSSVSLLLVIAVVV